MARLPLMSGDEFVRAMLRVGYLWDHTHGSHMILVHPSRVRLSVPRRRELGRRLLRDAGLSREEFTRLI